jgi:hypothetical protein
LSAFLFSFVFTIIASPGNFSNLVFMAENVLFGSEFDSRPILDGVNEIVVKLAELKEAQKSLREETARLNGELDKNQKELAETKKSLDEATKAGDPAKIKALSDQVAVLTAKEKELKTSLKEANTEMIVLQKGSALYNKEINETVKFNRAAKEELGKFASVGRLAGEALGTLRSTITSAAFGLVSGLAGGIIAVVLPALIKLGEDLFSSGKAAEEAAKKHKAMQEVLENAAASSAGAVTKLELYRAKLNDTNLSEKERIEIIKTYNKTADEKNKIDETQVNNLTLINQKLDDQKNKLIQAAIATAAIGKIQEKAQPFLEASLKFKLSASELGLDEDQLKSIITFNNKLRESLDIGEARGRKSSEQREKDTKTLENYSKAAGVSQQKLAQLANTFETLGKTKKDLDDVTGALQSLITVEGLTESPKGLEGVTNVFVRELTRLKDALAQVQNQRFPSELNIAEQFQTSLNKQLLDIDKFLDKKSHEQVTPAQANFLKEFIKKITGIQEETALAEFRKKVQDITDKLNDQINQAQTDNANKRIANIRDEFERERQQIDQGFINTVAALTKARDGLLKQIDDAEKAGLDHATAQRQRILANSIFGGLVDQATVTKNNQGLDLAFKTFENTLTQSNTVFEETLVQVDENIAKRIVAEKNALAAGAINYETFQKRVTALLKQQKEERDQIRKEELNSDLQQINIKLNSTTDPEQLKKLQDQARQIRDQLAAIDSNVDAQKEDPVKKRIDNVSKYAQSVGSLLNTIGSFWNQVNAIEQKSLERSISLQEKRVEEATRIAERGNAEYLNQEQDRLDQLELKRAASARKQQAINSALVLSNALVATVSAIAQAASTSGPAAPFAAIAAGIAVIGAIVAAFQFVQSLQPPEATFFRGTEDVQLGGNKPGVDTVPARLTEHERVVTARENKDYFETLTAIHNRKVSPEVLNSFVKQTLTGQKDGKGEIRLERTVVERFREKAEKDRLTKTDRELTRDIAREVSTRVNNNLETERVFNYVQNVLTERLQNRPLIVPGIMKLIREQVTSKESTRERTSVQQVNEVLDTFSERMHLVTHELKQADRARTSEVIRELTKVIATDKDVKTVENLLTTAIYNPETARMIIPIIKDKLTNNLQNKGPVESKDTTKEMTRIIERFSEKINGPEREKVIQKFFQDRFISDHKEYQETIETIFDRKIDSKTLNEFVEHSVDRQYFNNVLQQKFFLEKFDHFTEVRKMVKTARDKTSDFQEVKSNLQLEKYKYNSDHLVERIIENNRLIHAEIPVINIPRTEVPVVSYGRLEQATDHSTEMKGLLSEQIRIMNKSNELQIETNKILKAMDFTWNIDENGLSGRFMKYMHQKEIDKKV